MSDKLIVTVDAQISALVPRFLANRIADVHKIRNALASADYESIRVFPRYRGWARRWRRARCGATLRR